MTYDFIRLPKLPHGYKNGRIYGYMHFHIENMDAFVQENPVKKDYINHIYDELITLLSNQGILYQSRCVGTKNNRISIIYKDNVDFRVIDHKTRKLVREINSFTLCKMNVYFGYDMVMLLENDREPNALQIRKKGNNYFDSEAYKTVIHDTGPIDLNEMSDLTPYMEFKAIHKTSNEDCE